MKELEKGQKVTLKKGLIPNQMYGGIEYRENMKFDGVSTIRSVTKIGTCMIDTTPYYYTLEMLDHQ